MRKRYGRCVTVVDTRIQYSAAHDLHYARYYMCLCMLRWQMRALKKSQARDSVRLIFNNTATKCAKRYGGGKRHYSNVDFISSYSLLIALFTATLYDINILRALNPSV